MKRVHFIAIGGSIMHQMAIMMHLKGFQVSGSDDVIFEPALSALNKYNIITKNYGWNEVNITKNIDAIILGMHAQVDNVELLKAQQLGLKIYSFPEYIYEQTKDKLRIIIGGSHGKTTTTAMLIHLLYSLKQDCDYLVGANLLDKEFNVSLQQNTKFFVGEGDEYLASKLMPFPKFHFYKPHIAILTGIAWDHINVFPNFEIYKEQFTLFINTIESNGSLIFNGEDSVLNDLVINHKRKDIYKIPYKAVNNYINEKDEQIVEINGITMPVMFFGNHNFQNLGAVLETSKILNINYLAFLDVIKNFKGVSKRLELVKETNDYKIYRDFAHSPSKLIATLKAIKQRYSKKKIIVIYELYTYSSLNEAFLSEYSNTLDIADIAFVYYSLETIKVKKMTILTPDLVKNAFKNPQLKVLQTPQQLQKLKQNLDLQDAILLLMSSGNYDGVDFSN